MKTHSIRHKMASQILSLALAAAGMAACSSDDDGGDRETADAAANGATFDAAPNSGADAMPTGPDAMAAQVTIPSWSLEDIQPESPMFGQTYGLDAFDGKILIAVLVEGF